MAAFIDEAENNYHVNTLVLYASIENVALIADIPCFFSNFWQILSMYRWFVYSMFVNSGEHAASFLVPGGFSSLFTWVWSICSSFLAAWGTFSCRLTCEFSTSDFWITEHPVSWCLADSFSFIVISGLTRHPKLGEEVSSLYWVRITRFTGLAFAVGEPSSEVLFFPRFDTAPIIMRSPNLREMAEKFLVLSNHKRWFHSFFEKLP